MDCEEPVILSGMIKASSLDTAALRIAVASNFRVTLEQLIKHYQTMPFAPPDIQISAASTGKLVTQILHGAPYDLFLAADANSIERLIQDQLVRPEDQINYAIGQLALWQPGIVNAHVEHTLTFNCLAIANAKLAPYGAAAEQVLQSLGLVQQKALRIIRGQSVAQVYQFVASGNCEAGLLALSQLITNAVPKSQWWQVPQHHYAAIRQKAALLKQARDKAQAKSFWSFLKSPAAAQIIEDAGYLHPQNH